MIGVYNVQQRIYAGDGSDTSLLPGHVAYITTGSKLPIGANAGTTLCSIIFF